MASPTPSATPTPSPSPSPDCPSYTLTREPAVLPVGETATITVSTERATSIGVSRRTPGPSAVVRQVEQTEPNRAYSFTFRLGESHLFDVRVGNLCGRPDQPVRFDVRPTLTIDAVRNGPRYYAFSGRVMPGRGQTVSLYRTASDQTDASRVLTARTVLRPDGTYRIDRRFTGSGQFRFFVHVPESSTNLSGESRLRPTVIH